MGLFDIIKKVAGSALSFNTEKMAGELSKNIVESRHRAAGQTDTEINEVQNVLATRNAQAMNQNVMIEEALKKQGYSQEQIKEFIAKTKTGTAPQ